MKALSGFTCTVLLACAAIPAFADSATTTVYIRSDINTPWGQSTNEDAMDTVFGVGKWDSQYYETANTSTLFVPSTKFIFMEGGDSSYSAFAAFVQLNLSSINYWLGQGGRLLIMAAPNDPLNSATLTLPDSIVLHADSFYASAASSAYATDISSPIFSGPKSTAYSFTGDFFSHGYFTGSHLSSIMQSNLNEVVLGEDQVGPGLMVFGGMTTDNFQLPQPAAHGLLENIIFYAAYAQLD